MRPPEGLTPVDFGAIEADDLGEALAAFRRSAERIALAQPEQRPACPTFPGLASAARAAFESDDAGAFFRRWFQPFRLTGRGFVTAYYEPEVEARLAPEAGFETPVLSRPPDLVTLNDAPLHLPTNSFSCRCRGRRGFGSRTASRCR